MFRMVPGNSSFFVISDSAVLPPPGNTRQPSPRPSFANTVRGSIPGCLNHNPNCVL